MDAAKSIQLSSLRATDICIAIDLLSLPPKELKAEVNQVITQLLNEAE
jgi:hypothetical protein